MIYSHTWDRTIDGPTQRTWLQISDLPNDMSALHDDTDGLEPGDHIK